MEDIEHYNIPIYNFPYDVEEDDEDTIEENSELRVNIFIYEIEREKDRKKTRGRLNNSIAII